MTPHHSPPPYLPESCHIIFAAPSLEDDSWCLWPQSYLGLLPLRESSPVVIVQSLSHVRLFATPWAAAGQASLSISISQSILRLMSIESVMPSNCLILCHPLLLLPPIFPSIRGFSNVKIITCKLVRHTLQRQNLKKKKKKPKISNTD